jgi:hypothetical protein
MRKLLIILLLSINSVISATRYYVKNGGNDSAAGTSDEKAWAHHPWMSNWKGRAILVPGDIVYMKRGDTWSIATPSSPYLTVGQSGRSGHPIKTTCYGPSGNKPVIKITGDYPFPVIAGYGKSFIIFENLDIEHYSLLQDYNKGQSGIKFGKDSANNTPHDWIITNCDIHNIPYIGIYGNDDSYNIIIGNISATSAATLVSYSNQIYDCGYAGVILCGRDPVTNHSNFTISYNYIHDIDSGGGLRDAYGISFSTANVGSGKGYSTGWPNNASAKFNRISNIPGHTGVDCHGGKNIFFQDNFIYNCLHGIIAQAADRSYAEKATLDDVYIERNTVENSGNSALEHHVFISAVAENVLFRVTNCVIKDNILFYTSRPSKETDAVGISLYNADNMTIEGNEIFNGPVGSSGGGILFYSQGTNKVRNSIVRNNWIYDWDKGINLYTNAIDGDISFINNIIYSHFRPFVGQAGTISYNIFIYNNTFLTKSVGPQPYVIDFVGSGEVTIAESESLTIMNNIFGFTSTTKAGMYIQAPAKIYGSLNCDFNLFWNSTNAKPFILKGSNHNWKGWHKYEFDKHGIYNTDPLFTNSSAEYSKKSDFILQKTSPAINKGTIVNEVTTDYSGNSRDANPDIGACEYIIP